MENPETLASNLKSLMDSRGWSYKQLAAESGVSYHTVFRAISKGIVPRGGNLQKLALALGVAVGDLWDSRLTPDRTGVTLSDLSKSNEKILELLEQQRSTSIRSPAKPYGAEVPPEVAENWQKAGTTRQLLCLYLLTGEDQYKRALKPELKSRLEAIAQYVHLKRSPAKKAR